MATAVYSFTDATGIKGAPVHWIGFDNYREFLFMGRASVDNLDALKRTLIFCVAVTFIQFALGLFVALIVNQNLKGSNIFRTIYFMPVAMSMVVAGVIWRFMLDPGNGLINEMLRSVGLPTSQWTGNVQSSMVSVLMVAVWKSVGYFMIILLAGIQDIPSDYLEAAQIDGASKWQAFRYIVMPLLRPTSFFVLVILSINSLQAFDQIYVMTRGGPAQSTYTLLMYIYEKAFREWNFGYSGAMAVVLFAMVFILTLVQVRFFRSSDVRQ
jgi:ABC-type sugar transport system permease subunit